MTEERSQAMDAQAQAAPNVQQAVPFFAVSDMEASIRYYVDGLGFEMTLKWIDDGKLRWCWLQRGGAALMLQEFRTEGHDTWVPEGKVGEGVSICFICEDALAIYHEVTGLSDPDGYQLYFESATDAPEETVYSNDVASSDDSR